MLDPFDSKDRKSVVIYCVFALVVFFGLVLVCLYGVDRSTNYNDVDTYYNEEIVDTLDMDTLITID